MHLLFLLASIAPEPPPFVVPVALFMGQNVLQEGVSIVFQVLFGPQQYAFRADFHGHTRRISREAPVLILSHQANTFSLGGAGNSLLNLKALGAEPYPVGVVGADAAGRKIRSLIRRQGIPVDHLLSLKAYPTPLKTRVLAGEENTRKQQILRIDREGRVPDTRRVIEDLLTALKGLRRRVQALLISDYQYFTVKSRIYEKIRPLYQASGLPVTLDSRFRLLEFQAPTVLTPNEPEAEGALQSEIPDTQEGLRESGRRLLAKTAAHAVLLTRGSRGMVLYQKRRPMISLGIRGSSDIVDDTGAGDTVISVLTLALACGSSFRDAAELANYAGGLVVMKKGTATVTADELRKAVTT